MFGEELGVEYRPKNLGLVRGQRHSQFRLLEFPETYTVKCSLSVGTGLGQSDPGNRS